MNFKALSKTSLFYGTTPREAEAMLNCLGAVQQCFTKGKTIYRSGTNLRRNVCMRLRGEDDGQCGGSRIH